MTPPPRPLFVSTLARSGGTLLCHVLSAHGRVEVASDPALPLMKALRNALAARAGLAPPHFDPGWPFQDCYFTRGRTALLDALLQGDLDMPWDDAERAHLVEPMRRRGAATCPDLIDGYDGLAAPTWTGVIEKLLGLIRERRGRGHEEWIGFKEVWTTELTAALARSFPDARFIVLMRDPRAVVASMLELARRDPDQRGPVLAYARHWRKDVALCLELAATGLGPERLLVLHYEHLVGRPEATVRSLCKFLEIDFDPAMLRAERFVDRATGRPWTGNSSFAAALEGISAEPSTRWRDEPRGAERRLVELVCGPDLELTGYQRTHEGDGDDLDLYDALEREHHVPASWRSDLGDPLADLAAERLRRHLLVTDDPSPDHELVRRCFLLERVFDALRQGTSAARRRPAPRLAPARA